MFIISRIEVIQCGKWVYEAAGIRFDVRDLANLIPHFTAGGSVEEHQSLMQIAACTELGFLGCVRQARGFNVEMETCEMEMVRAAMDACTSSVSWAMGAV